MRSTTDRHVPGTLSIGTPHVSVHESSFTRPPDGCMRGPPPPRRLTHMLRFLPRFVVVDSLGRGVRIRLPASEASELTAFAEFAFIFAKPAGWVRRNSIRSAH